jgi:hypothetical protein
VATLRSALRPLAGPFSAFLLAQAIVAQAAALTGQDPRNTKSFVRWDSYRYVEIARDGYAFDEERIEESNAGWFPGYPLVIRGLMGLGLRPAKAGRLVAEVFALGTLIVMSGLLAGAPAGRRWPALLLAALFPGCIYHHAVFPISMTAFFSLASAWLWGRGWFALAGLAAGLAVFAYPTGALTAGGLLAATLLDGRLDGRAKLLATLKGPGLAALGLVAVFAYHAVAAGRWDAFLQVQRAYGQGIHDPATVFLDHTGLVRGAVFEPRFVQHLQTLVVAALVLVATGVALVHHRSLGPADMVLLAIGLLGWILPQVAGSRLSIYRQEALLLGIVPFLARLPAALLVGLLSVVSALALGSSMLFFQDVLV